MPIYDYRCDHCGHAFSAVQSFNDPVIDRCPSCGKQPRRLIVPPAIVFKGSGWYKTDSRKAPAGEGGTAKSESAKSDAPSPSADAKPADAPKKKEAAS